MISIVVLGGTGDTYLVCSLLRAFEARHGIKAKVVVRQQYEIIAEMFRAPYETDDAAIARAEGDLAFQRDYDNEVIDGRKFYAHPCMLRIRARADHLTTKPDASQGDMYKMILRIPPATPLDLPRIPRVNTRPNTVTIIPGARSWPRDEPMFWEMLAPALRSAGWAVEVNDRSWSLRKLFLHCASSEWVIGAQCGVMSILATGRFPCRKTFATPNIDDNLAHGFLARDTFPYGYVTKFSNFDFDIEEFKIGTSAAEQRELIETIANGANAQRLWPHDPEPINNVMMPLSPGDFLDRLAILTVKRERFDRRRKAAIEREYQRHVEGRYLSRLPQHDDLLDKLIALHRENYDLLERMVPGALDGNLSIEAHVQAVRMNRTRIAIKREIDGRCRGAYTEVKSYYGDLEDWRPSALRAPQVDEDGTEEREQFIPMPEMRWAQLPLNAPGAPQPMPIAPSNSPVLVESVNHHNIVRHNGRYLLIPQNLGPVQLETADLKHYPRITTHGSLGEARSAARSYCGE